MSQSWRRWSWQFRLVSSLAVESAIAFCGNCALSQIVPDATLGDARSVVIPAPSGLPVNVIVGGATQGTNLFHSFEQFSVPTGGVAYFNNGTEIRNIISRVTGRSISSIDGAIRANGTANLFLLNPSGIIFGPNAALDIGGSFVASTASSLKFADGKEFSSTNSQTPPLLTVNVPIGLQFVGNAGSIVNQSQFNPSGVLNIFGSPFGLLVQPGRTLALVGGDLRLEGGNLTVSGGRIELGSVSSGLVGLTPQGPDITLRYEGIAAFKEIQLSGGAIVNASGLGGGNIQVRGGLVTLTEGASIVADTLGSINGGSINIQADQLTVGDRAFISASTFGAGAAGSLFVSASESVELIGNGRFDLLEKILARTFNPISDRSNGLFTLSASAGAAGNLTIDTGRLLLRDGAAGLTGTLVKGQGGNLSVTALESVELVNSGLIAGTVATGASGNIKIDTGQLIVRDGALVATTTLGDGTGGAIDVKADAVELSGTPANALVPTGITATTDSGTGAGGNITIDTRQLTVQDGTVISTTSGRLSREGVIPFGGQGGNLSVTASDSIELKGISADRRFQSILGTTTFSPYPAGDLKISTGKLIIRDGAVVSTTTVGAGQGGTLTVDASDSVELTGTSVDGRSRSGLEATSGSTFFPIAATGASGDSKITTGKLIVRDGAEVAVSSLGAGNAGDLEVVASSIELDGGNITAATASGEGGNIKLPVQNLLLLRNNGQISTEAGTDKVVGGGNGGDITIDANFIVAVPSENSDIIANAFDGRGGNVRITTQGIFGLERREQLTENSDITAFSQRGPALSGEIDINTPDVDPSQGLVALSEAIVDVSGLIASGCSAGEGRTVSQFVVTGRGGLPSSPSEVLSTNDVWQDWRPTARTANASSAAIAPKPQRPAPTPIVEATGWVTNDKGEVTLVATAPTLTAHSPTLMPPADCYAR